MDTLTKPDITTGNLPEKTPILANAEGSTADSSKPAQVKNASASIKPEQELALLQSDFSDLQSLGLRVVILAKDGKLYASIEFPGHVLGVSDTGRKSILLDGKAVVEYE